MSKNIISIIISLILPFLLFITVWQSNRYYNLHKEVVKLYSTQESIVEDNKKIISEITNISTPENMEKIAEEKLFMRKALPNEIIRIELIKGELGG